MAQDMEQLYRRHYQTVYRYALRLTGSEHAAEELAAETFYRAMVALPDFRGECAASTWLCQIAKKTTPTMGDWRDRCAAAGLLTGSDGSDARRKSMTRLRDALLAAGMIERGEARDAIVPL